MKNRIYTFNNSPVRLTSAFVFGEKKTISHIKIEQIRGNKAK